ncbi:MAG: Fe-S cluster assembly scaffold protein NifU [Candidatus Aminicenantes bacterium]|nr:Fe-S cluster assembly scaffold protein NifU [Candidatus Aminicenantes bacterium]
MYSDKVMEHFQNPKNVGVIKDADGVGKVGNPVCGDLMTFYIKVEDNHLADIKFQTFGCGAAIAVSSMVSEMAMGKSLDEAMKITNMDVAEELGGLPKNKLHCSNLGADALHAAIKDYQNKESAGKTVEPEKKAGQAGKLTCPYCDGPMEGMEQFCQKCQLDLEKCPECGKYFKKDDTTCPHCGATKVRV